MLIVASMSSAAGPRVVLSKLMLAVTAVAALTNSLLGKESPKVESLKVVDAEEVKPPAKTKTRTAAATTKKAPEPEPEEEEEEGEETEEDDDNDEGITYDVLKDAFAKKVNAHRDALVKKLKTFGVAKLSELEEDDYKAMYDYLLKLK